ncbi:FAD-dependent thymidylate synthase [Bacteroides graminisolvens]
MKLYKISSPHINESEVLSFLNDEKLTWARTDNVFPSDEEVELAGRLCYMSFGSLQSNRNNGEYITNLIDKGHESVLEHVNWSFILTGVSRGFTHQLVRHRIGFSFSQLSQQYYNESNVSMIKPSLISRDIELSKKWDEVVDKSRCAYIDLLKEFNRLDNDDSELSISEKREIKRLKYTAARSVLPNAAESKIFVTANARAIRHFLTVRGAIDGDEEMRIVSAEILKMVQSDSKSLFSDFYISKMKDGTPIVLKQELA